MITIYHNPRCSKSREALTLLEKQKKPFTIVKYLSDHFTHNELATVVCDLNVSPIALIRTNEAIWKQDHAGKEYTDTELIDIMVQNPQLIERPIIINGNKAIIARPAEKLLTVL